MNKKTTNIMQVVKIIFQYSAIIIFLIIGVKFYSISDLHRRGYCRGGIGISYEEARFLIIKESMRRHNSWAESDNRNYEKVRTYKIYDNFDDWMSSNGMRYTKKFPQPRGRECGERICLIDRKDSRESTGDSDSSAKAIYVVTFDNEYYDENNEFHMNRYSQEVYVDNCGYVSFE